MLRGMKAEHAIRLLREKRHRLVICNPHFERWLLIEEQLEERSFPSSADSRSTGSGGADSASVVDEERDGDHNRQDHGHDSDDGQDEKEHRRRTISFLDDVFEALHFLHRMTGESARLLLDLLCKEISALQVTRRCIHPTP